MTRPIDLVWGDRSARRVDGVDVHVETAGPDDAPRLAALHGFASGTFTWAGVAGRWSERHRVVAWDRPPFGRSGRPKPVAGPDDPYALSAEIRRAVQVLGRGAEQPSRPGPVLVGHSAGALLAVQLVAGGHLRARGLVLIAPALDGAPPPIVRTLAALPGSGPVGGAVLRVALLGAEPALKAVGRHRSALTDATAAETARLLRRPGTASALFHLTRTWKPPAVLDSLSSLDVPALVVGGTDDRIVSRAMHETVAERLGAELHLLEGVGHAAHEQAPDVVGPLIGAFVEGIGR